MIDIDDADLIRRVAKRLGTNTMQVERFARAYATECLMMIKEAQDSRPAEPLPVTSDTPAKTPRKSRAKVARQQPPSESDAEAMAEAEGNPT